MKAKVVYCKSSFDGLFACTMIPMVSTKNLFVDRGILYERETLKLCTPKSYLLNFIRLTNKFLNKSTILKITEEQLENGSELGRSNLTIIDNTDLSGYGHLDDVSVHEEAIDLDESRVVDMINKYIREEEEW